MIEASHFFDAWSDTVLSDPRVQVVLEDEPALAALGPLLRRRRLELRTWVAGTNNLHRGHLPGVRHPARGVFCQWIQAYEISPAALGSLFRSFAQVFHEAQVFLVNFDLLVVAEPTERTTCRSTRRRAAGGRLPETLWSRRKRRDRGQPSRDPDGARRLLPRRPLNTDDRRSSSTGHRSISTSLRLSRIYGARCRRFRSRISALDQPADVDSVGFEAGSTRAGPANRASILAEELLGEGPAGAALAERWRPGDPRPGGRACGHARGPGGAGARAR